MSSPMADCLEDLHPSLLNPEWVAAFDFTDCWTFQNDAGFFDLDVAVALARSGGNMTTAAGFLRRGRRPMETFVFRNPLVKDYYEDLRESFLDELEELARADARTDIAARWRYLGMSSRFKNSGSINVIINADASGL